MEYLIIKDQKIERHISSLKKPSINVDETLYEVNDFEGIVGEPISFYTKDWIRKDELTLMKENLIPIPEGYKLENDELTLLNEVERIERGLDDLSPFSRIENGKIVDKTKEELLAEGLITEKDLAQEKLDDLRNFLDETDWMEQKCIREGLSMNDIYPDYFLARTNAIKTINDIEEIYPDLKRILEIPSYLKSL